MLLQIIIENGVKKLKPLTADAGAGNPVGTIIVVCSNRVPSNYLPLGTQYDTTQYPLLYAELGTDTTPTAASLNLPTLSSGQYVIKATSGLSENAQDNVINTLNEQRSYSTEEHLTGRKWIDGKPTYEKTFVLSNVGTSYTINVSNLDYIINYYGNCVIGSAKRPYPFSNESGINNINSYTQTTINLSNAFNMGELNITIEYTKTTN